MDFPHSFVVLFRLFHCYFVYLARFIHKIPFRTSIQTNTIEMLISKFSKLSIATNRQYYDVHGYGYIQWHTFKSRFIQMKIHFIIIIITVNAISIMVIECKACCHRRSPRHHHQAISFRKTHAQHTISFVLSLFELSCELSSARLAKCD